MRRGWKTTEFWVTAFVIAGIILTSVAGVNLLPGKYRAVAAALAASSYTISRGLAKFGKVG
jgi:hypothetical protein